MTLLKTIYLAALSKWGHSSQINMAVEEAAELIQAIQHHRRGRCTNEDVAGEIANMTIGQVLSSPPAPSFPSIVGPRKNTILRGATVPSQLKKAATKKGVPSKNDVPAIAKAFLEAFGDVTELNGEDLRASLGWSKGQINSLREQLRTRGVLKMKGQKRAAKWTLDIAKAQVLASEGYSNGALLHA